MAEARYCLECNSSLADDAPEGLCPKCLLRLALTSAYDTLGPVSAGEMPSLTGDRLHYFGDYELLEEIARGGMGIVYRARQMSLNRVVAIKMMRPGLLATEVDVERFRVEAEAAASLQHPGIVSIHEVGEHAGLAYFSMDYVEGKSLADIVRTQPLPAARAAGYLKSIAEAVHFAHDRNVLHRDLKPANVIIDDANQPRITDFGLAKRIEGDSRLTATGAILGTPSYMPPEHASAKREPTGPASDVYSLGAMLYEMLTGRPPFQAETPVDTLMMVLEAEPVTPRALNPKLDRDIETICLKCLEKDPRRRYASAQELADDLERFLSRKPIKARRVNPLSRGWRWCRRNPWPATAAAVILLLAIVSTFAAVSLRNRLWQSIVQQARSERLAGDRARSMQLLAQAARMKKSDQLRQEAIQTITTPGVRLHYQIPFVGGTHILLGNAKSLAIAGEKTESYQYRDRNGSYSGSRSVPKIEVWDLESNKLISSIDYEVGEANGSLAISPAELLLAASTDEHKTVTRSQPEGGTFTTFLGLRAQSMVLFNAVNGEKIGQIKCEGDSCTRADGALMFAPDGRHVVRAGQGCAAWLVDIPARTGRTLCLNGRLMRFFSDDELLLNCNDRLAKWNIYTTRFEYLTPEATSFVALSGNAQVAVLRSQRSLVLFEISTKKQTVLDAGSIAVDRAEIILSQEGRVVAITDKSAPNVIQIYEASAIGVDHRTIAGGTNRKFFLERGQASFSPDGCFLTAFGGEGKNGSVWLWDVRTGAQIAVMHEDHSPMWTRDGYLITRGAGVVTMADGGTVSASWNYDGIMAGNSLVNIWEVFPAAPVYLLPDSIRSIGFTPDGNRLFSNGVRWNVEAIGDRPRLQAVPQNYPPDAILLQQGEQLWLARVPERDFLLRLWRIAPDPAEITLESPDYSDGNRLRFARPEVLAISPDGSLLLIYSSLNEKYPEGGSGSTGDNVLELWDLVERRRVAIWTQGNRSDVIIAATFSPDGKYVATSSNVGGKEITIRDASDGSEVRRIAHPHVAYMLLFSRDGKMLFASGSSFGEREESPIYAYEVATGRGVGEWRGHTGTTRSIAVSPDGKMLAAGGDDRSISLVEIPSGRQLAVWEAHGASVTSLAFSPDGRTVVSGSTDGTVKLWNLPGIRRELSALGLDW